MSNAIVKSAIFSRKDSGSVDLIIETDSHGIVPVTVNLSDDYPSKYMIELKGWIEKNIAIIADYIEIVPSNAEKIEEITAAIQSVLDAEAQSRNYDDINAIGKYLGFDNAFLVECVALGEWTAAVWSKAYELLATWKNGGPEITKEQVLAELPKMDKTI